MKLLILVCIISNVYCGITNDFVVCANNDIYLAHTENSVIYKIKNSEPIPIVGLEGYHSKSDTTTNLLYRPTSIISNLKNDIYFVNNNKYIKNFKTTNNSSHTQSINFNATFNLITNITIDYSDNLYIANYSIVSGISKIYKFKKDYSSIQNFNKENEKVIVNEEIKAINYVNDNINVITNKNYYKYSFDLDIMTQETRKIESTNNTNKFENIQDFVIDENFEIGYIAFQERLKWFYV